MGNDHFYDMIIDIRRIVPDIGCQLVFATFGLLQPGEAFLVINDRDPNPLRSQFSGQHAGEFGWDYEEKGPDVWRVRISRAA